jgi:hypothetical protein
VSEGIESVCERMRSARVAEGRQGSPFTAIIFQCGAVILRHHRPCEKVRGVLIVGAVSRAVGEKWPRKQEEQPDDHMVRLFAVTRR